MHALNVKLHFSTRFKFPVMYFRDHCREDYLEIYDGPTAESPLIGRFCGHRAPEVTASGSHMFLVFTTETTPLLTDMWVSMQMLSQ